MARQVIVQILGDASKFTKTLDDAANKSSGFGSKIASVGKLALGVGVAGIGALTSQVIFGAKALGEQEQALAISENTIKRMGDAAWTSKDKVAALAQQVQDYSGIDNTAVIQTENLLLTFGNVQDRIGKGNDVFTQATKLATDMSVVLGTDAKSSAIQLGKALNDPIQGVTALRRVGVSFTDAQLKQIKTLQKNGDLLGAQKIILGELSKEFGGAAEAAGKGTGVFRRLGATWEDFQKLLASAVLPVVADLGEELIGLIKSPAVQNAGAQISAAFAQVPAVFERVRGSVEPIVRQALPTLQGIFNTLTTEVVPAFATALEWVRTNIIPPLSEIFGTIAATVLPVLQAAFDAVSKTVHENWPTISKIAGQVATFVAGATRTIATVLKAVSPVIIWLARTIFPILGTAAGVLLRTISVAFDAIGNIWGAGARIADNVVGAFNRLVGFLSGLGSRISYATRGMWSGIWNAFRGAINAIIRGWNGLRFSLPSVDTPFGKVGGFSIGTPNIPYLHTGGVVPGVPGSDVLAMLQAGERVIPRASAGGQTVIVNVESFIGSDRDIDHFADRLALRLRMAGA